ncbi:redox-sensitive transcriptional activator SoxR [Alloyangia pacifica]|uniref:MerR family transcriptional regulator, redox-sensitive transcriptional activator SoxR n=1 Tax=Alloyangia pacifica TaxID=311180 RepID=A0A1I6QIE6_9RHOB|nr:redox-sensitive transcriptional activator SoxR [Alloyangia pacifica]SDF90511.1 MerR family transcriptional regulator, redox-sensitive transcriptional activator SoxR [Alloyangia pacifica]SFS52172.1 MerR family transcriptional regulator, redox-sensitive transcriptional activator SoxR [Alloyangia pacifica]
MSRRSRPVRRARSNDLSVGEVAARAGVAVSTLHFYEAEGLIESWRTDANHRRYDRRELRRIAVIRMAQKLGVPLAEIREMLSALPRDRALSKADWQAVSQGWRARLDARIRQLEQLRDELDGCIGCGCLSLESCPLYNPSDRRGREGPGPRVWIEEMTKDQA